MSIKSYVQNFKIKNIDLRIIYAFITLVGFILASLSLYFAYRLITKDKIKSDNSVKNNRNKNEKLVKEKSDKKEIANRMRQEEQMQKRSKQLKGKHEDNQKIMANVAKDDQARKSGIAETMMGVKNMAENVIEYGRKAKKDTEDTMDSIEKTLDKKFEASKDKLAKPIKSIGRDVKKAKKNLNSKK